MHQELSQATDSQGDLFCGLLETRPPPKLDTHTAFRMAVRNRDHFSYWRMRLAAYRRRLASRGLGFKSRCRTRSRRSRVVRAGAAKPASTGDPDPEPPSAPSVRACGGAS